MGPGGGLATRGENGAVLGRGQEIFEVAAAPVQVVDTLGAGDMFISRTLVGLLREEEPPAAPRGGGIGRRRNLHTHRRHWACRAHGRGCRNHPGDRGCSPIEHRDRHLRPNSGRSTGHPALEGTAAEP